MTTNYGLYSNAKIAALFPKAAMYRTGSLKEPTQIREVDKTGARALFGERHLQCIWFDDSLRPAKLKDIFGEDIIVHDPGRWNLEKGPDFLGAVLEVRSNCRRICGDVEIHIDPEDWNRHGHSKDPSYGNVCAHVTYFDKALPDSEIPSDTLQVCLKRPLHCNPLFSFDDIDLSAYPFDRRRSCPCSEIIDGWSREMKEAMLEAAGQERLLRKSERFLTLSSEVGLEQAAYIEIMRALGYKHNKPQFSRLAEIVPLKVLHEEARGSQKNAYALLMGVAGLLPLQIHDRWDRETVEYVRHLWKRWIQTQDRWRQLQLTADCWNLNNTRPQNRIERRLSAAAAIFCQNADLASTWIALARTKSETCVRSVVGQLQQISDDYWSVRLAWSGKRSGKPSCLIGASRANAIAANVLTPLIAATGGCEGFQSDILAGLKPEPLNSIMRLAANTLFGPDHPRALYGNSVKRQGLMQIFYDYCLTDKSGCRECQLPELLKQNH